MDGPGHVRPRLHRPSEFFHDFQPRPHPHHPCRQPAAQRKAVRSPDAAGGRRSHTTRRRWPPRWTRPSATSSRSRWRPASTSAMTASSSGSASRPTCRSACRGFAGVSKRRRGREFEEFPELLAYLMRRFPHVSQAAERAGGQAEINISTSSRSQTRSRASRRSPTSWHVLRAVHDRALARHHLDRRCSTPTTTRTTPISTRSRAR